MKYIKTGEEMNRGFGKPFYKNGEAKSWEKYRKEGDAVIGWGLSLVALVIFTIFYLIETGHV